MAISMGAVFMGAMTYIGNAPNFMVVSIVQNRGIKMPTFFWLYDLVLRHTYPNLLNAYLVIPYVTPSIKTD